MGGARDRARGCEGFFESFEFKPDQSGKVIPPLESQDGKMLRVSGTMSKSPQGGVTKGPVKEKKGVFIHMPVQYVTAEFSNETELRVFIN